MELRTERTSYALDLSVEDFRPFHESDNFGWEGPTLEESDLPEGVHSLEFTAHFGPSIYFTVDADDDNEATHAAVRKLVEDKLAAMREHMNASS